MTGYFSDRENGPRARAEKVISPTVWAGLVGTVQEFISSGAVGSRLPERRPDGQAICGGASDAFAAAVIVEMPGLAWPLETTCVEDNGRPQPNLLLRNSKVDLRQRTESVSQHNRRMAQILS